MAKEEKPKGDIEENSELLKSNDLNNLLASQIEVGPADQPVQEEALDLKSSHPELGTWQKTIYFLVFVFVGVSDGFLLGYKGSLTAIFTERKVPSEQRALLNIVVMMYVLRMFVAPITDKYFWPFIGKRKSYLLPCKLFQAAVYYLASSSIDAWVDTNSIWTLTGFFFILNVVMLFEYNSLVGFRLDCFGQSNASSAASSATIGLFLGLIFGLQVFTALNSKDVCRKFFSSDQAILTHGELFVLVSGIYLG